MCLHDKLWPGIRLWNSSDLLDNLWKSTQNEKRICFIDWLLNILLRNQINRTSDHESNFFVTLSAGLQRNLVVAGLKRLRC